MKSLGLVSYEYDIQNIRIDRRKNSMCGSFSDVKILHTGDTESLNRGGQYHRYIQVPLDRKSKKSTKKRTKKSNRTKKNTQKSNEAQKCTQKSKFTKKSTQKRNELKKVN